MVGQKYLWIIERKIGNWSSWVGKVGRRRAKGPMPDEQGKMKFGKGSYATDPNKYRIWKVPKGIKSGDVIKLQLWAEDDPTPKDFFTPEKKVGDIFTASLLKNVVNIKRLELSRANKQTDKVVIILAIALMVAMGAIAVLGYLVVKH